MRPAPADLVACLLKVVLFDVFLAHKRRAQGGFVNDGGQVGAGEAGGGSGEAREINAWTELHLTAVYLENLKAALHIRQRYENLTIKSAGAGQGRVQHVHAVGGGTDDHLVVGVEAVHLDEDCVEGLLAFVVTA